MIPNGAKQIYRKVRWFCQNYSSISPSSAISDYHFPSPITYNTDNLATCNNADFIHDVRFTKAYAAAAATNPWEGFTLQWRVYICCYFGSLVQHLPGDYVECGVNTGVFSRAVIDYVDFNRLGKTFFLLDTFEGFPASQLSDAEKQAGTGIYEGDHYKNVYEQVKRTFRDFNVKLVKGRVPETLAQCDAKAIAYLSIDMNAVVPEIAAAQFFWDRVVKGGVVILDDYGFPSHINQKIAFDAFAHEKGVEILSLPTGQGVILKNV